ncbi:MAG: replicative DNA helicase [Phycisphaerales bacterium]|nr:replicative DNA helicase [Phycisphaerales bacterium]MBT7170996.1 replicative DNA helicase [Phycisphaerales bacterium]
MPETRSPVHQETHSDEALNRVVPHNIEAEACVLGAMILEPVAIDIVAQKLKSEHFHRPAHQIIFDRLIDMREASTQIDLVSMKEEFSRSKQLETIGGIDYLVALVDGVPGIGNVEYYADIVKDKSALRGLISVAREIVTDAYDSADDAGDVLERAEKAVFDLTEDRVGEITEGLKGVLQDVFRNMEENAGKAITGMATGFAKLDDMTGGFHGEELLILAARPSMGKTSILLNIAEHMAVVEKKPIAFFSLEMSSQQIAQRLLASNAQYDLKKLRQAAITPEEWTSLQNAANDLNDAPFYIDDSPVLTPLQLRAKARRMKARFDIQVIFIDYLQLMSGSKRGNQSARHEEVGEISRSIKALARELDIPILCAAQLNRGPADRPTHTPRMSDLRESGSLEQDADVVMLLHNEDYYHRGDEEYVKEDVTRLIIEKQRNGPTGVIKLVFRPECTKFESAAPEYMGY